MRGAVETDGLGEKKNVWWGCKKIKSNGCHKVDKTQNKIGKSVMSSYWFQATIKSIWRLDKWLFPLWALHLGRCLVFKIFFGFLLLAFCWYFPVGVGIVGLFVDRFQSIECCLLSWMLWRESKSRKFATHHLVDSDGVIAVWPRRPWTSFGRCLFDAAASSFISSEHSKPMRDAWCVWWKTSSCWRYWPLLSCSGQSRAE